MFTPIPMFDSLDKTTVYVYKIITDDKSDIKALCWIPERHRWEIISIQNLIPVSNKKKLLE